MVEMGIETRKKKGNLDPLDRMSTLPDEIVLHILGFMPTLDSVRTSVLSKRWNNMWTSVPKLSFNDRRDFPNDDAANDLQLRRPRCDRFVRFISSVLYSRDSIHICRFCLSVCTPHHLAVIDDWISAVLRRNVVELRFANFLRNTTFTIPRSLLMCKTLKVLRLYVLDFDFATDAIPTPACFPSLKVLHVTLSSDNQFLMEKLFSCCNVLEDLTVDGKVHIELADIVYNFNVCVPQVKTLSMSFHVGMVKKLRTGPRYEMDQFTTRMNVYIDSPKLEKLDLKKDGFTNYVVMGIANSLVNATIDANESRGLTPPHFPYSAIALLVGVSNVKYLSLVAPWSKVTLSERQFPRCDWSVPKDVPVCLLLHLKSISISGFNGQWVEREIARYLLKNGLFLTKMLIYTDGVFAVRLSQGVFSVPRGRPS